MTQRDDGHDYRDSKNKAMQYEKNKKTVVSWTIQVKMGNGDIKHINDLPDDMAQGIDDYLSEWESKLWLY